MATTQSLIDYYTSLLILQYRGKPKATAMIASVVTPVIMDQIPKTIDQAYAIDQAVGAQLDVLAKYAGVSRRSLAFSGVVTLNDRDLRILVKMKLIQNNSGSSLANIQKLIFDYFSANLRVFDNQAMQLSYFFNSSGSQTLAEVFVRQQLLPRPMGVQISSLIYVPSIDNGFSLRTYSTAAGSNQGLNSYGSYSMSRPFLNYSNVITY